MSYQFEGGPERRAAMTRAIMAETGIDEAMIATLVQTFYARVRRDPLIGPIFEERITDWDAHIEKLCAFWSSVALMTGRYHGQPMRVHLPLPVGEEHFNRWLALFEATATELCPPAAVTHFMERARRIADSLEFGIASTQGRLASPRHQRAPAS
ncbi:MAG TPA: group III truncated hemoglobin [Pseudolabrys sp.]|nr:group III truncated hemoglobin [Pseudolabrys sp.]